MPSLRRRALVVEGERPIRELLRLHLDLAGFALDEAGDGRLALDAARATLFDLIRVPSREGRVDEFTSQLYFADELTDRVHAREPYSAKKGQRLLNART